MSGSATSPVVSPGASSGASLGTSPVAIVTGGGSGIGAATATRLRADGWEVLVCGRRLEALEVVACSTGAIAVSLDITAPGAARQLVDEAVGRFGRLDGVVLNAGVVRPGAVGDLDDEGWEAMLATNLSAPFRLAREAIPHLVSARGSLVAVASMSALRATSATAGYNATKAGLAMLVQSIAVDHGASGLRANVVCPGWTRTEMADGEMAELATARGTDVEAAYRLATALVPLGRPAAAAEVAAAVAWLLSAESSYINGAVLPIDGGQAPVDPGTVAFDPRISLAASV